MRTTLTIDPSIAGQLRELMVTRDLTLKAAIHEALREGIPLAGQRVQKRKPFVVLSMPLGLRSGIDADRISQFADELDDIDKLRKGTA